MTRFADGAYVRLRKAPDTRQGTVRWDSETGQYIFHLDDRLQKNLPEDCPDCHVPGFELESCSRPSDADIEAIIRMVKDGGGGE